MNILTTEDISDGFRDEIFDQASDFAAFEFRHRTLESNHLVGRVVATVFLEPSTRTRLSFETAALRMGAKVISVADGKTASVAKGESLYDTLRTVGLYADAIVVRTSESLATLTESQLKNLPPIINAGDGRNHHPTQALLDFYTIKQRLGRVNNILMGIAGDHWASRTVKSFMDMCEEKDLISLLDTTNCNADQIRNFDCGLKSFDVLYLNRIQRERHDGWMPIPSSSGFCLNRERLARLKSTAVILNPGPRKEEMPEEFDDDPRNAYWEQMKNGLYIRMALLKAFLFQEPS